MRSWFLIFVIKLKENIEKGIIWRRVLYWTFVGNQEINRVVPTYKVVTIMPIKYKLWACSCSVPRVQHSLDWYGKTLEHAEWRKSVKRRLCQELCAH